MEDGASRPQSREWRALISAEACSVVGDQAAKVALALIAFDRAGAAVAGALYALSLLPELVAGPLLSPLADRWPRRSVMIVCALIQAALVGTMLIPAPVVLLAVAVAGVGTVTAPAKAAQAAAIVEIRGTDQRAGQATISIVRECGQLAGLGIAGSVVAVLGASTALAADAATFLAVAVLLAAGVRPRPAPPSPDPSTPGSHRRPGLGAGWRAITATPRITGLVVLVVCVSATAAPEAVLGAWIAELHAPPWAAGLLVATDSLGLILTARLLTRHASVPTQRRLLPALPIIACAPLMLVALRPSIAVAAVLLAAVGAGASFLAVSRGEILDVVPDHVAASVTGIVRAGLRGGQGLVALLAGALAETTSPSTAIGIIGSIATLGVGAVLPTQRRADPTATSAPDLGGLGDGTQPAEEFSERSAPRRQATDKPRGP